MSGHGEDSLGRKEPLPEESPPDPPFSWQKRHTLFVILCVVVAAVIIASVISIPYYAITPGTAQSVESLIGVPKSLDHKHSGEVLLVDVELTPLRAIEWPYFALDSNAQIIGSSALLGPESAAQYDTEGVLDMSDAQQAATVVALSKLGYNIHFHPRGALLYALFPDSPAGKTFVVGDVATAVDGVAVTTAAALSAELLKYGPGETVRIRYLTYPAGKVKEAKVRLSAWRIKGKGKTATIVCPPYGTGHQYALLHVSPETHQKVNEAPCIGVLDAETSYSVSKLPFRLDLSSEGIIGPSAGLAFTLGLMQKLDPYDLTGGHKVAATGTMSVTGAIGPVGGVAQKTIAVRNSGARIFFVPPAQYKVARSHAGDSLKIYAVSSISQVLRILESYGGRLPSGSKAA